MAPSKAFVLSVLVSMVIFLSTNVEAREFMVGGKENSWEVPSSPSQLNQWAQSNRFKVGDVLSLYHLIVLFFFSHIGFSLYTVNNGNYMFFINIIVFSVGLTLSFCNPHWVSKEGQSLIFQFFIFFYCIFRSF